MLKRGLFECIVVTVLNKNVKTILERVVSCTQAVCHSSKLPHQMFLKSSKNKVCISLAQCLQQKDHIVRVVCVIISKDGSGLKTLSENENNVHE